MAIQTINLGAPVTGEGGDTYRDAHTKINANFSDVSSSLNLKANTLDVNSKNTLQDNAITSANNLAAAAIPKIEKGVANGVATLDASGKVTSTQIPATSSGGFYAATTTAAPNTTIAANGLLQRSTMVFGTAATKNTGVLTGQIPLAENITSEINTKIAANVTQVTGQSTTLSPSQKLLTDQVTSTNNRLTTLESVSGKVINGMDGTILDVWVLTQAQLDAIAVKDDAVIYMVKA